METVLITDSFLAAFFVAKKPGEVLLLGILGGAKVDKSLCEPRCTVRAVPGSNPLTCFRCGWIGHYANHRRFKPYAGQLAWKLAPLMVIENRAL